jgi:hypothetical protein
VHIVTMPVSCGRGLTSENHTSSPGRTARRRTAAPAELAVTRRRCRALRQRHVRHRLRLPATRRSRR